MHFTAEIQLIFLFFPVALLADFGILDRKVEGTYWTTRFG
jgi:hypothetical protein